MSASVFVFQSATGPYSPTQQDGGATTEDLVLNGPGASFDGTYLEIPAGTFLDAGEAGIDLPTSSDPALTQAPESIALEYVGIVPADCVLAELHQYNQARFTLMSHWAGDRIKAIVERDGTSVVLESDDGISSSSEEILSVRYDDDPNGAGGTVTFLRNGQPFGASQTVNFKLRVTPQAVLQSNASLGNTGYNSKLMKVRQIGLYLNAESTTPPTPPSNDSDEQSSTYTFSDATGPFLPVQNNGGVCPNALAIIGSGASFDGTYLDLPAGSYLDAGSVGIDLTENQDPALTRTPASFTLEYVGIVPADCILAEVYQYNQARFTLMSHWVGDRMKVVVERDGTSVVLESDTGISGTNEETLGVRYDDDPEGTGGTITFLRAREGFGDPQPIGFKLKVTPDAVLQSNASLGNTSYNSKHMQVRQIALHMKEASVTPPSGGGGHRTVIYGDPGTRFPINIALNQPAASSYELSVSQNLNLEVETVVETSVARWADYSLPNAVGPFSPVTSSSPATSQLLELAGQGATFSGGYLQLTNSSYLSIASAGLTFVETSDPATTQTPIALTLSWTGILPAEQALLVSLFEWAHGQMLLKHHWETGRLSATIAREGFGSEEFLSDTGLSLSSEEEVGVRYEDDPNGSGGTITFLRSGVPFGASVQTTIKPRITSGASLECNASLGNTTDSTHQSVKSVRVDIETTEETSSFAPLTSTTLSAEELEHLWVNALNVSSPSPSETFMYQPFGAAETTEIDIVVGSLALTPGQAFRAILEDWSSGVGVDHANALEMTRPARQNCRFEDGVLHNVQGTWSEWLPRGPVPIIDGIAYYCEAIRLGDYAQFQFGYDWSAATMPDNPFGDPTGNDSYMRPHKWRIEDVQGNTIATVGRPDGGPLNGTDVDHIFQGPWNGLGHPMTDANNGWYPHGTVRAAVVWRSGDPDAYDQAFIDTHMPRYDVSIGYAGHAPVNNGFDLRLVADQLNGFGIWRCQPFEPSNYADVVATAGQTLDPWTAGIYTSTALGANGATWLKYTPFSQCGRSPITGPGGVRDDRVAIADPVCHYMYDISANRPHDGTPLAAIALDYLTSYASDPFHCFEADRCVPLFKGENAVRVARLRNHYYGFGEASIPASQAYYVQGGRTYEIGSSFAPFRANVPANGIAEDKPYFGTNEIDQAHAHQFPHWGSYLFKTPEFAFLGHKFSDQSRMYDPAIIGGDPRRWVIRDGAWAFLHSVLCWKTASANSDRLYSREEVLAWTILDFETFHDQFKVANPGFDNPPSNILDGNGAVDPVLAVYAATSLFGGANCSGADVDYSEFQLGYWLTALGIGEKLGFNQAMRQASTKAGSVLDWIIARHRQRVTGRINEGSLVRMDGNFGPYNLTLWKEATILASGGNVANLPQGYSAIASENLGQAPSWDQTSANGDPAHRSGQAMDQLMAAPSILKNQLGQSGASLDAALNTVTAWRDQKKVEQEALGASGAGSSWFQYLQGVNNPVLS